MRIFWKIFKPHTKGVKALLIYGNEILLVKNIGKDYFMLPGGNLNLFGEDPQKCIAREIKEELDITITPPFELLGTYTSNLEGKKDTIFVYIIKLQSKEFEKKWELDDAKWFSINSNDPLISPATKRRIDGYLNGEKNLNEIW